MMKECLFLPVIRLRKADALFLKWKNNYLQLERFSRAYSTYTRCDTSKLTYQMLLNSSEFIWRTQEGF